MKSVNYPLGFNPYWGYFSSTTWIFQFFILLPNLIFSNPILSIKYDIILIYLEYFILSYLLSNLIYKTFSKNRDVPLSLNIIFISIMFINYDFLYTLTSSMMPALFGIPIFLYILIKSYRIFNGDDKKIKDYAKLSLALVLITLGDPRFFIWAILAFIGIFIFSIIIRRDIIKSLKIIAYTVLIALPAILFIYYVWIMGSFSFQYVSPRPLTYSEIDSFSKSFPFFSYFQLTGMSWPAFIYSPPSILFYKGNINNLYTVGNPTAMIYPFDLTGNIWFVLTFFWFSLSIISMGIFAKKNERLHIISFILLFILTIGTYFPVRQILDVFIWIGTIPILGGVWGITYAIPNYFMWAIYPYIIFYISIAFVRIYNKETFLIKNKNFKIKNLLNKKSITVIILILLIVPNYQFFVGGPFPGQYSPVLPGNGISSRSPLSPIEMPKDVQYLYNYFSDNYNVSYNIVWPQAWGFTYKWSPITTGWYQPGNSPPPQFFYYLTEIAKKKEYYMLKPLMDIYGVRYFVVDNTSYVNKNPILPFLTNTEVVNFFENSPGIKLFWNDSPNLWVFEDPNASVLEGYSMVYSIGNNSAIETAYYFSKILNETPLLIRNSNANILFNSENIDNKTSIFTYDYFSNKYINNSLNENDFDYSYMKGIYNLGNDWYFGSTKGNGSLAITNSIVYLNSSEFNYPSLSYGDFLSPGHTGIYIPDGYGVNISVSYDFLGNNKSTSGTSIWVTDKNYTRHGGWYFAGNNFKGTGTFRHIILNTTIPPGYTYFEVQINSGFNGSIIIKNISISYSLFRINEINYSLEKVFNVEKNKNYTISFMYEGNGTFTLNEKKYYLDSLNLSTFIFKASFNSSIVKLNIKNISLGGLIIIPNSSNFKMQQINYSKYEYLQAGLFFTGNSKFLSIATPHYDWQIKKGKFLGFDAFGREIFYMNSSSNNYLYVKNVYLTNIVEIIFIVLFYFILIYIFLPFKIFSNIKNKVKKSKFK